MCLSEGKLPIRAYSGLEASSGGISGRAWTADLVKGDQHRPLVADAMHQPAAIGRTTRARAMCARSGARERARARAAPARRACTWRLGCVLACAERARSRARAHVHGAQAAREGVARTLVGARRATALFASAGARARLFADGFWPSPAPGQASETPIAQGCARRTQCRSIVNLSLGGAIPSVKISGRARATCAGSNCPARAARAPEFVCVCTCVPRTFCISASASRRGGQSGPPACVARSHTVFAAASASTWRPAGPSSGFGSGGGSGRVESCDDGVFLEGPSTAEIL